ncbi:MAG: ABC transporter ATP-binding protein [Candidatus Omnitrophica bacterium]|nr:ABC transporter ATP-binding protein [Candidatus Omnitrophota bacterium]MDD5077638.1 ABC transporter ATP-binding protein [Candidatus Omnitrophota bacterium]MDD5724764.1 ABC transporter ATP-binding protein [Candidatus Omnitrophota bacterium]
MLKVVNLTCGYQDKTVLSGVSFEAGDGEFLGVIGPNGSGKTTLLRAISRVIPPAGGRIFWKGEDIQKMPFKDLAKEVAVVSQSPVLDGMTVEEFVLLGRIPYYRAFQFFEEKKDYRAAERAMELTGMSDFRGRTLNRMSGGEKQLALIARALAQEPKLLLLDEPTAHLDIAHQVRILDLVRKLNRDLGLTVMIVLHDLNLAGEYCRKLLLIEGGKVYRSGLAEEVLNYRDIRDVYKTPVLVEKNPVSLKPYIVLVSENPETEKDRNSDNLEGE